MQVHLDSSYLRGKVWSLSLFPGEHTNEILEKLGYKREGIENLGQQGIIC
jgi:crotonobetainyl-CoA:carnitine CoA-transferase CaiB-like acyl-CoA transferase